MTPVPDANQAAALLHEAAQLIVEDPNRRGSLLTFGAAGQLVLTGDMHGNLKNFEKLQRYCNLPQNPGRSVILHELIHEEPARRGDPDLSIDLLIRAAQWKCDHPDNVYFLQSNHELSQLRGHEITKGGRSVLYDFERGVRTRYPRGGDDVLRGVQAYLAALPFAARTQSGVFVAHSLPDALSLDVFNPAMLERQPTDAELAPGGAAYGLVWGRFQSPEVVELYARKLGAEVLVVGHTPQETGYTIIGRMIILASDHSHGVFLPVDLSRKYSVDQLESNIRKFVSVE